MAPDNTSTQSRKIPEPEYVPIRVTAGILMHIGAGIYSSVAGAIKELVSNSFDADATQVLIDMDYPAFNEIKVVDNGCGMGRDRFKQAMQSIGSSLKRTLEIREQTRKHKRPIIGHLGIGLMALSQVCASAEIESQEEGSDTKFRATIDFAQFQKREAEQKVEATISVLEQQPESKKFLTKLLRDQHTDQLTKDNIRLQRDAARELEQEELGYCLIYPDLPAVAGEHGTTITLKGIRPGVKRLLSDEGRNTTIIPKHYKSNSGWTGYRDGLNKLTWGKLCQQLRAASSKFNYQNLPMYYQFLWELSLMTPVKYFEHAPVTNRPRILQKDKKRLIQYDFSLRVDMREMFKPIILPAGTLTKQARQLQSRYDFVVKTFTVDKTVGGDQLKYHGYLFWQREQIEPQRLRGIQIYIRNVGIGLYDYTLMNYGTRNPAHRAAQVSGEIYVEKGLEGALNIDRNSFRESDSHYLALQDHVWKILGSGSEGIFGQSVDSYFLRRDRKLDAQEKEHVKHLRELVKRVSRGHLGLSVSDQKSETPYQIENGRVTLYKESRHWPRALKERLFAQKILLTFEAAVARGAKPREILDEIKNTLLTRS